MIWVLIVAAVLGIAFFLPVNTSTNDRASSGSSSGASYSNTGASGNQQIPSRLQGIHPDSTSFWNTEEFYSRLGEECAKITDKKFVLSMSVQANGNFSATCSFIDSARVFFPALGSDLQDDFYGHDDRIMNFGYTAQRFSEIIQDDAPSAQIQYYDDQSGKSFTVVWNPNGLP